MCRLIASRDIIFWIKNAKKNRGTGKQSKLDNLEQKIVINTCNNIIVIVYLSLNMNKYDI